MARIVVGMSGGVDSSVAALLLKRAGHEVIGVFMKNWEEKDDNGVCTSETDWADVRGVCEKIDIPYYAVNFVKEYYDRVFSYFLDEYRRGRTPNPDVLCNREIKFKAFLDFAMKLGADRLATGHFCQLGDAADGKKLLLRGADGNKDQSYFLYMLGQNALEKAMFPVGGLTKAQVREIAEEAGLANSKKKDSTGVCFIGERHFKPFLQQFLPAQPGDMRTLEGKVVGRHDGLMYYTLGQRRGLGIGGAGNGERWFVLAKDMAHNELIVTQGADHPLLYSKNAVGTDATWISGEAPAGEFDCTCKYRYRQPDQAVHVSVRENGQVRVTARERQRHAGAEHGLLSGRGLSGRRNLRRGAGRGAGGRMNGFQKFWGHLSTVTRHRHRVIAHCARAGILWQGLRHDLSKYSPTEFWQGVKFFDGTHSPTEDERRTLGYSLAWMHHKGRNRHHWEYWTDYSMAQMRYVPVPMPRRYMAEMICDRIAASKIYNGERYTDACPLAYLQRGKMHDHMHPDTQALLARFLTQLRDEGEDAMFASLRQWVREKA